MSKLALMTDIILFRISTATAVIDYFRGSTTVLSVFSRSSLPRVEIKYGRLAKGPIKKLLRGNSA